MTDSPDPKLIVEYVGGPAQALELEDVVSALDSVQVQVDRDPDEPSRITGAEVALVVFLVWLVPVTAAHLVESIHKIRARHRPMSVLDLTGEDPVLHIVAGAEGHEGEMIVKTREGEEYTLVDGAPSATTELAEMLKAALPGAGG